MTKFYGLRSHGTNIEFQSFAFVTWMSAHNRLQTQDRMQKGVSTWKIDVYYICKRKKHTTICSSYAIFLVHRIIGDGLVTHRRPKPILPWPMQMLQHIFKRKRYTCLAYQTTVASIYHI